MEKHEKGFSLIIVLFAVVIFSVMGLSLFTLNYINAKQINLTKDELLATDLAEMGIIYYETLYSEHSFTTLNSAIEDAKKKIEDENKRKKSGETIPINSENLLNYLNKDIFLNNNIIIGANVLNNSNGNFRITSHQNVGYNSANKSFKVIFTSEGFTYTGSKVELDGEIIINFEKFIDDYVAGDIKNSYNVVIPKIGEIENIKNIQNKCLTNLFISLDNCIIKQNVTVYISQIYKNKKGVIDGTLKIPPITGISINNSILYVKDDLIFNNWFDLKDSIIYSEGEGEFGNGSGLDNTTLYVKNGGSFGNVTDGISGSRVYSNGDFTFGNISPSFFYNNPIKNSKFIINGNLNMGNINVNIMNSTFYIKGEFKTGNINKSIDDSTIICAGSFSSKVAEYKKKNPSKKIYNPQSNPDQFKEGGLCYLGGGTGEVIKRDPTSLLNNLDVDYN
ncbi:type IV pilus modification PilV family protein [Solibacillus sp. FSL K6-4121]|uniref:type IV pilus modification PilV family protein n=1 Tax=Solibacillus sp. FSL K6-4121 TaxID=2921505 RepID=UPI0030F8CCAE